MSGDPFTMHNFGLGGQVLYGPWDEFFCLSKKCREKRAQEKEERRERRDRRKEQREEKRDLKNDKLRLKNEEREAAIIRTQTETNLLAGSIANNSTPGSNTILQPVPPVQTGTEEFDYLPWAIGGGIVLLMAVAGVVYWRWKKNKSIPETTPKAIPDVR